MTIPQEVIARGAEDAYRAAIQAGSTPRFAEMVALRQAPGVRTDATAFTGMVQDQFGDNARGQAISRAYRARAEKAGVSTVGKRYFHTLADSPGDPKAWVSSMHEVKQVERRRVERLQRQLDQPAPEPTDYTPAESLVREHAARQVTPDMTPKEKRQLVSQTRERLKPSWAKQKPVKTGIEL